MLFDQSSDKVSVNKETHTKIRKEYFYNEMQSFLLTVELSSGCVLSDHVKQVIAILHHLHGEGFVITVMIGPYILLYL